MTARALLALVGERLEADTPPDAVTELVLASFHDADAVAAALRGTVTGAARTARDAAGAPAPAAVFLMSIEVEGFRGIGAAAALRVDPGPGLTLVVGRNGSGKSSFSEALEMLLRGTNTRWSEKTKVWREGWQNLHHRSTRIVATFTADGRRQPLEVQRVWTDGADVDGSMFVVDGKPGSLDTLGWRMPLDGYPPLLSHHELEGALDKGPAALYDALASILGLGDVAAAQERLRQARLGHEHAVKEAQAALLPLRARLEQTDDERAGAVFAALKPKQWDIAAIERSVSGSGGAGEGAVLRRLRDLNGLPVLDREALLETVRRLRDAHDAAQRQRGSDAARAYETAALLQQALDVHSHGDGESCPVCGTARVITYEWRVHATKRVAELRAEAQAVEAVQREVQAAANGGRRLVVAPPVALRDGADVGVDTIPALELWKRWADVPAGDDVLALAVHLETHGLSLIAAVAEVRRAAVAEMERLETSWRPAADAIIAWLPLGRAARDGETSAQNLKAAEAWLKDAHDELRDERFRPIADAVQATWSELRQDSNVTLGELKLAGASTQRRLTLDVRVDGESASALGVMSQGELNCLALSLFLPRASLPESPFRFVVIDDPVQAMDPAKVEGLARTLARAAQQRQVIVLTHDNRLAEAVRYLDIEATVVEVVRREQSVVELRRVDDPVQRYIDDAFAIAKTDAVPAEALRVIPGFCRMALEAASSLAVTRRMLHQGKRYAEVQEALEQPTTLVMWLALALLKDATRGGDVNDFLEKQHPEAAGAVRTCNRGAHGGAPLRDPMTFIRSVEKLTKAILAAPAGG